MTLEQQCVTRSSSMLQDWTQIGSGTRWDGRRRHALSEQARLREVALDAQCRREQKASALVRLFDQEIDGDAGQLVRRDQVPKDAVFRQYPSWHRPWDCRWVCTWDLG